MTPLLRIQLYIQQSYPRCYPCLDNFLTVGSKSSITNMACNRFTPRFVRQQAIHPVILLEFYQHVTIWFSANSAYINYGKLVHAVAWIAPPKCLRKNRKAFGIHFRGGRI